MILRPLRLMQALGVAALALLAIDRPAQAVPSFASQTGQPCTACHVGAFGPQLTGFGRAFKIGGYTLGGGEGTAAQIPLAGFVQTSFTHTQGAQNPPPTWFAPNDNPTLDQVSLFLAGRFTDYAGAMIQATYSGTGKNYFLDNTDIRLTTPVDIGDTHLRIGVSLNNGPMVQDPFNSSLIWGPPYQQSSLTPGPVAEPLIVSSFAGNTIGMTAYAWYDNALYGEFGFYQTMDADIAKRLGQLGVFGTTMEPAPYARLAYEWDWGGQTAHLGVIGLHASVQPAGVYGIGTDKYDDVALDVSYQWNGDGTNIFSFLSSITHESQRLDASYTSGAAANHGDTLNEFRATATYFYQNTYGASLGVKRIWGSTDVGLYNAANSSNNGSPNTTEYTAEVDWVPFGKDDSWQAPFANVKFGLQYSYFPQFNGAGSNYDGNGRNAHDNNTIYAFAWFAF